MAKCRFIQKSFAAFLLAVFVLCNTPTTALHYLFANHKDVPTRTSELNHQPQIQTAGIDCHCISNVVNAPFLFQYQAPQILPVLGKAEYIAVEFNSLPYSSHDYFQLRAPPVLS